MMATPERTGAGRIQPPPNPLQPSDLSGKPTFPRKSPRRTKGSGAGIRLRETGANSGIRSSHSETPLLSWKLDEGNSAKEEEKSPGRQCRRRTKPPVSARKLAASLWRLRLPSGVDHFAATVRCHHEERGHHHRASPGKGISRSPNSVSGSKYRPLHKFEPSFQFPNEGATKWASHGWKASSQTNQKFELDLARGRVNELETERKSSKKKLDKFLHKLSEEQAMWRTREHEKVRAIIQDTKADLKREKMTRHKLEMVNSELVNKLTNTKLVTKRYLQEYEKEKKTRELIEEICDELAKEIGEDKDDVEALTKESLRLCEEVEDERRMLQMAEVWREERVQMKLADSKVMLEDKYLEMNTRVADLESFLKSSSNVASDSEEVKRGEFLMEDVRELTYKPRNLESHASKIHTVSPEVRMLSKNRAQQRFSDAYADQSGELGEYVSEWETVSHLEDQGSSYSLEGSEHSINRNFRGSSVSKIWKNGGDSCKIVTLDGKNGRVLNGVIVSSPDGDELLGQLSSFDSGNLHINRAVKGCVEWTKSGHGQKNSLKSRLLQARIESQKVQLWRNLK